MEAVATAGKRTKKQRGIKFQDNLWGLLFVLLPIIGTTVFVYIPLFMTIYASFTSWSPFTSIWDANFTSTFGANYKEFFTDANFWATFGNTFFYMIGIPLGMILAMLIALLMNRKIKGGNAFRVIYYIPVISSVVSIALLFSRLFDINGVVNKMLGLFNVSPINWIEGPGWLRKLTIVIMLTWKGLGGTIILFIAGLQGVNETYYEAAKLDGAGSWRIFWTITMPQLYPIIFYVLVTSVIGGAQIFNEPALFYPASGAGDYAVMPVVQFLYNKYFNQYAGLSSAIGVFIGLIVLVLTLGQFSINKVIEER